MAKPVSRNQSRYLREMRDFPTKVAKQIWKKFARKTLRLQHKNSSRIIDHENF